MQKSLDDDNNQNTKFDVEKIRAVKTMGSNEVEASSTVIEEENDSRSKQSSKIPKRYLNYELD